MRRQNFQRGGKTALQFAHLVIHMNAHGLEGARRGMDALAPAADVHGAGHDGREFAGRARQFGLERARDAPRQIEVEQEILAERLLRRDVVERDDVAQRPLDLVADPAAQASTGRRRAHPTPSGPPS